MNNAARFTAITGMITSLGFTGSASGQPDYGSTTLGGRIFAITGEYLFVADIGLPFSVGDTFQNCYTFTEDESPDDGLDSGIWIDPLFPSPGPAVPGTWIQHNVNPEMRYTAVADAGGGVTIVQNGWLQPFFAARPVRLKAYSTVSVAGLGVIAEVFSRGSQVEECPYELP